jgi:hypothetical protein
MTALDIIPEVTCPPTDLWSDEPPLASDLHLQQIIENFGSETPSFYDGFTVKY